MWSWITEHFAASDIAFARKTVSILLLLLLLGMFILVVYSSSKLQQVNIRKIMENVLLRASDRMQAKQESTKKSVCFCRRWELITAPEELSVRKNLWSGKLQLQRLLEYWAVCFLEWLEVF